MDFKKLDGKSVLVLGDEVSFEVVDDLENVDDTETCAYALFIPYEDKIQLSTSALEDATEYEIERIVRHELTHAFMFHSSLQPDLYPVSEEFLTEWIAQMFPRMQKTFEEVYSLMENEND